MSPTHLELFQRNMAYAASHHPLPTIEEIEATGKAPPKTCVLTCADPRIFPEELLKLNKGEAFIFRTIAGRPQPIIQDIITLDTVSRGFDDVILLYHTDCGAYRFDVPYIRSELSKADPSSCEELERLDFGAMGTDLEQCLRDDLAWFKAQRLVRKGLRDVARGYVYDIKSGRIRQVA